MTDDDALPQPIATTFYNARLTVDELTDLVGAICARRFRLLKADLEDDPLDLAPPENLDIYDGDATAVESASDDDC